MDKKTIGIIGTGKHFFKRIYPMLKNSKFFEIKGILNRKRKIMNFINLSENDFFKKKFDFIYISTPNKLHEKFVIRSLKNDSHVICEKPFIISKKNINKILGLSRLKKKLIFESFAYVYHPVFKFVKQQIKNWPLQKIKKLIFTINEVELLIKKNSINSLNILADFILKESQNTNN